MMANHVRMKRFEGYSSSHELSLLASVVRKFASIFAKFPFLSSVVDTLHEARSARNVKTHLEFSGKKRYVGKKVYEVDSESLIFTEKMEIRFEYDPHREKKICKELYLYGSCIRYFWERGF